MTGRPSTSPAPLMCCLLAGAVIVFCATVRPSAPPPVASPEAPYPDYPRRNLASCFEVDPNWPQRPAHVTWGAVTGVAVDRRDRVWVATHGRPRVQIYESNGTYQGGWGDRWLRAPHQIRVAPDGTVWVVDAHLHVVRQFTPQGKLLLTLGTPGVAGAGRGHFNTPTDVSVTNRGDIFITDGYRNSRVVHYSSRGRFVKEWGKLGTSPGELSLPHSIVSTAAGRLYVAERANGRLQVFDRDGRSLAGWSGLVVPWGLAVNQNDELWVCGSSPTAWRSDDKVLGTPPRDQLLIRFDQHGKALQQWYVPCARGGQARPGELQWVHSIAEDSRGNLYCGDVRANRVQKFVILRDQE